MQRAANEIRTIVENPSFLRDDRAPAAPASSGSAPASPDQSGHGPQDQKPREQQQEQFLRDMEIDPHLYYPPDADRPPIQVWPDEGFKIDPRKMLAARGIDVDDE